LAQRAFCAARIRAIAAGDILRRFVVEDEALFVPLTFAQRARCAAAILARPAADMPPRVGLADLPLKALTAF
jgi:hypothetical protein